MRTTHHRSERRRRFTALLLLCAAPASLVLTGEASASGTAVAALYADHCAQCHGANLRGSAHGSELSGSAFADKWGNQSWEALAELSMASMPPGQPSVLSPAQHRALAQHIFRHNKLEVAQPAAEPTAASNSWSGAAGVAEMARSRNAFQNGVIENYRPVDQATLNNPPAEDWLSWRRTLDGQAETPLKQINRRNAKRLGLAWAIAMNDGSAQITPLVRDGIMFLVQPGLLVQALKADTGDLIWQYQYPYPAAAKTLGGPMRNFAIYGDSLYIATYDAALIALDAKTGALQWRTVKADYTDGYTHSAGPIVGNGVVISGINGCERYKQDGCFITGHDAATGAELWRTSTIQKPGDASRDIPKDTWAGLAEEFRAGGDTWIAGSYDAQLDLFYIGTSQAKPWVAPSRSMSVADAALYTNSTLALRPKTGELVWYYQHIPGETIDMEVGFERVLATVDGKRYVFTVGKDGVLWQLAADDGAYVAHLETMPQDIFESIDPGTGAVTYRKDIRDAGVGDTFEVCPGIYGGHNWQSMAYDSNRGQLILPLHQLCGEMTGRSVELALGDGGFGGDSKSLPMPSAGDNLGKLVAINVSERTEAWSHEQPAMFMTGVLTTATDLAFVGDLARYFKAFDTHTGKVVWQTRLAAPTHGYPISYAVDGRQYVAVPTGMGVFRAMTAVVSPQIHQPANGQALYVFALPQNR